MPLTEQRASLDTLAMSNLECSSDSSGGYGMYLKRPVAVYRQSHFAIHIVEFKKRVKMCCVLFFLIA